MLPSDIEYLIDESFRHFIDTILRYPENPYQIDYEGMFFKGKANLYHKLNDIFKENEEKIEKDIKNREFEQKIIKVLENVGYTRGVLTYENDKKIYITGEQMNNYLACITLAELIRTGALELNFKEEKNERKMKYLKKLLKEG